VHHLHADHGILVPFREEVHLFLHLQPSDDLQAHWLYHWCVILLSFSASRCAITAAFSWADVLSTKLWLVYFECYRGLWAEVVVLLHEKSDLHTSKRACEESMQARGRVRRECK
jgi:hypothetical protein